MKVLYDISWLGDSFGKASGATGLGRVIETVACHLAMSHECELKLCAGHSFAALRGCLSFLGTHPHLNKKAFEYPRLKGSIQMSLDALLASLYEGSNPNLLTRAARRGLMVASRWPKGQNGSLDPASLGWSEIYHSPFLGIPKAVRRRKKIKCVLTVYDLIPIFFPELAPDGAPALLRDTLDTLGPEDTILSISEATKVDLCNYLPWLDPRKVFVTHLGASEKFRPMEDSVASLAIREKYGVPQGPYLLSLSSLEPRKGLAYLIECFASLVTEAKISDLTLVIAGPKGWKYDAIFQVLEKFPDLRHRVIITGRVDDDDLPYLYSNALAFVFPSLYEGFGLPVLEAMQCGAAVIAAKSSALPEVVGGAGILVEPRDRDALSQAMLELYNSEDRRAELSAAAIARARHFSWEKCTGETIAAYKVALDS